MSINSMIFRISKKKCIQQPVVRYLSYDYYNETGELRLPKQAKVVICGGGVMGASVAYHLAELGLGHQTIVLEKGRLGFGNTWQSSGLVTMFKSSHPQVKLCQATLDLYLDLHNKGYDIGWKQCGSISLARTSDRMIQLRRLKAQSVPWKIDCEIVTPDQIKNICPLIKVDDLKGGLWIPNDGTADPYKICVTLFDIAKSKGVRIFEECAVKQIFSKNGSVWAVESTKGATECEHFVNCGGFWARKIGHLSKPKVKVPVHPVEHFYLMTKPVPNLDTNLPIIRDQDGCIYLRELNGCLLGGGYEPVAKPLVDDERVLGICM